MDWLSEALLINEKKNNLSSGWRKCGGTFVWINFVELVFEYLFIWRRPKVTIQFAPKFKCYVLIFLIFTNFHNIYEL